MTTEHPPLTETGRIVGEIRQLHRGYIVALLTPVVLACIAATITFLSPTLKTHFAVLGALLAICYMALMRFWGPLKERFVDVVPTFCLFSAMLLFATVYAMFNEPAYMPKKQRYSEEELRQMYARADSCTQQAMDRAESDGIPIYSMLVDSMADDCRRLKSRRVKPAHPASN